MQYFIATFIVLLLLLFDCSGLSLLSCYSMKRYTASSCSENVHVISKTTIKNFKNSKLILFANPVTADSTSYQDISEDEAFLWFDEAILHVRAGSGGQGSSAFKFGKNRQHVKPQGGSGGRGGDIILTVDDSINTLLGFRGKSSFKAENGYAGELEYATGKSGASVRIAVPLGTMVKDNSTEELIGEMNYIGQEMVIATGGEGGQGNAAVKLEKGARPKCSSPMGGQKRCIKLELNLVADIGLVGVPNAGKSTLLDAITNARPKIASYPFTTIVPNLGVCELEKLVEEANVGEGMIIADIPGLLEGAHLGVGLGRGFLRHIERCKIIIHIINGDSVDPIHDYLAINKELLLFSPILANKPQIVVLNKIDMPNVALRVDEILSKLNEVTSHKRILAISAASRININELVVRSYRFLKKIQEDYKIQEEAAANKYHKDLHLREDMNYLDED